MWLVYLIKGVLLGFSIAAPVGSIGVLCIRRTLANGMMSGFITGLGTATADSVYGCLAAFGVSMVSGFLLTNQIYLRLIGGLFLLYLGYKTFRSEPVKIAKTTREEGILRSFLSAFLLTIANPMTIMSFGAVFAGLGVGGTGNDNYYAGLLVLGVFTGSMLWWVILSATVNILRAKFDPGKLKLVNLLSGVVIAGFGVVSLVTILNTF